MLEDHFNIIRISHRISLPKRCIDLKCIYFNNDKKELKTEFCNYYKIVFPPHGPRDVVLILEGDSLHVAHAHDGK